MKHLRLQAGPAGGIVAACRYVLRAMLLGMFLAAAAVAARDAPPTAEDPQIEKRVMALAEELRCLVCQNQTIADSHADLALDLKRQIREQIRQGRDDRQIIEYMVARYGDFILYRPPFNAATVPLWVGPFALLVVAVWLVMRYVRSRGERLRDVDSQARARGPDRELAGDTQADRP